MVERLSIRETPSRHFLIEWLIFFATASARTSSKVFPYTARAWPAHPSATSSDRSWLFFTGSIDLMFPAASWLSASHFTARWSIIRMSSLAAITGCCSGTGPVNVIRPPAVSIQSMTANCPYCARSLSSSSMHAFSVAKRERKFFRSRKVITL